MSTFPLTPTRPMVAGTLESWEYLASYSDLIEAFGPDAAKAAAHYATNGYTEGRLITFDAWGYLASYDDLINVYGANAKAAAIHYVTYGYNEYRSVTFDAAAYLANYGDLQAAYGADKVLAEQHYIIYGRTEGRNDYTFSDNASDVNEGGTAVFTLNTHDMAQGTSFTYNITGVSAADVVGGSLTGTAVVDATHKATFSVTLTQDALTEGNEQMSVVVAGHQKVVTVHDTSLTPAPVGQTIILKDGPELANGTSEDDVFAADQNTLDVGDTINGGSGDDVLTVGVNAGAGLTFNGFETNDVEIIRVQSESHSPVVLDFSDVNGTVTIETVHNEQGSLAFRDIQSVNGIDISIKDTTEDHYFSYDANAYTAGVDNDNVDLTLEEIRNATISFGTVGGQPGASGVERITITSKTDVSPDLDWNKVTDLNVGTSLATVLINGNANLWVNSPLDPSIKLVNASTLDAKLHLDMSNEDSGINPVVFMGAIKDTYITFGSAVNNKSITTYEGNDEIHAGNGENTITSNGGNDTITSGTGNDSITSGAGNDIIDAGNGNNTVLAGSNDDQITTGSGADSVNAGSGNDSLTDAGGNNKIDMGLGNDSVVINGTGNNKINLGEDNDTLTMEARELEVADTISGDAGQDTFILHNTGHDSVLGLVRLSETQHTSAIETFDLRDGNITLFLTNNLITTATGGLTVNTESAANAPGDAQTVDMTNITAPDYFFTLAGGVVKDIVYADDETINNMSTLRYDRYEIGSSNNRNLDSREDTLYVVGSAEISATDTDTIFGLDHIVLTGNTQWEIELTDHLLNQVTDTASTAGTQGTLTITVDNKVPPGSKLYLYSNALTASDVNVLVERNANVTVYLDGTALVADGDALDYAGAGKLTLKTPLYFTSGGDSLLGTNGTDVYHATAINDLQDADWADGLIPSNDELVLHFGIADVNEGISDQLNNPGLHNIEILTFDKEASGYGVAFTDENWHEFKTYNLTNGADKVLRARTGHTFNTFGGNDAVTLDDGADNVTVNGGAGADVVNMYDGTGSYTDASVWITDVESVFGGGANDTVGYNDAVHIQEANTVPVYIELYSGNDVVHGSDNDGDTMTVYGGSGVDSIIANGGNDHIHAYQVEWVDGGSGNDTIDAVGTSSTGADTVDGNTGNDTIIALDYTHIVGGAGNDSITVNGTGSTNPDTIWGDAKDDHVVGGNDTINVAGNHARDIIVFGTEKGTNALGATLYGSAAHPTGYNVSVTSGFDTITGFTGRATVPTVDDILNVSHLLSVGGMDIDTVDFADSTGGDHNFDGGSLNNIIIAYNAPDVISHLNFSTTASGDNVFRLEQDGEAVLALTSIPDGDNVDHLDLYYVVDTDQGPGEAWQIIPIGVVSFDGNGLLGLSGGSFEDNFSCAVV